MGLKTFKSKNENENEKCYLARFPETFRTDVGSGFVARVCSSIEVFSCDWSDWIGEAQCKHLCILQPKVTMLCYARCYGVMR